MKQLILLERDDLDRMQCGGLVKLAVGDTVIELMTERNPPRKSTARVKKPAPPRGAWRLTKGTLPCPLCPATFHTPTGRGSHMKSAHGIQGRTSQPKPTKQSTQGDLPVPCQVPTCDRRFKNKMAEAIHRSQAHKGVGKGGAA